jgi:hypothetical protein
MKAKELVMEIGSQRRPLLAYLGIVWSTAISINGLFLLSEFIYYFSDPWYWNRLIYLLPNLLPIIIQIIGFSVISLAICLRKDWSRLSFILLSMILFFWRFFVPNSGLQYLGPGLITIAIGSWLFNKPEILGYFDSKDIRPRWISRTFFGIQKDLAFGLFMLFVMLIDFILYIERVGLIAFLRMEMTHIIIITTWPITQR